MERLTDNPCGKKAGCKLTKNGECCYAGCVNFQAVQNRLAAYEDTNLTPEEITEHEAMFQAYRHVCGGKSPDEITALREQVEREKECEHCTIYSNTRRVLGYDGDNDGIAIAYGDNAVWLSSDSWEIIVRYCPMCGRRLGDTP